MINQLFETLASDNGRKFKEELLASHAENETLREVVRLALCPLTQFYIRKIPAYQAGQGAVPLAEAIRGLEALTNREVTGHAAIFHLTSILSTCSEDDAKVVERIIRKDLRCGVSASTANKVWPGLIAEYPAMLASKHDDKLVAKMKWPACVQLKMDGMRANIVVKNGRSTVYSRNGKLVELLGAFDADVANLPDCVIDGELVVVDDDGKILDRKTGNGICNKAVKGTISDLEAGMVRMVAWDLIPYAAFKAQKDDTPYRKRFDAMVETVKSMEKVTVITSHTVENLQEAQALFQEYYASGEEGIILKAWDSVWENKRSKHHIKFKGLLEADLKVVGWQEGTGKHVGRLGALVCETECGTIRVNVGSGFSDAQRDQFTADYIVGKVVAVQYNAKITEKGGGSMSLFLPIFVEVRDDKDVANTEGELE